MTVCRRWLRVACILLLATFLSACQQELYSGLAEEEANQMLSTLLEHGFLAQKTARGKAGFTISVDDKDVVRALRVLANRGLPRERFKTIGEVFSGEGMIASPTEEQARLAFAIAQELAETFSTIDGVLTSRAHVVLEQRDAATGTSTPASAAVYLRHLPDSPVFDLQGKIRETCVQSVPGLTFERVSVMLVPVRENVVLPKTPETAADHVAWAVWSGGAILVALLAAVLGWRLWAWKKAAKAAASLAEAPPDAPPGD